ncbi:hypothetical protein ACLMJK_006067 [Lecanora helva]
MASQDQTAQAVNQSSNGASILGGMTDKLNSAVGGAEGTGNDQSYLGKGINAVQESVFGQTNSGKEKTSKNGQEKDKIHAAVDEAHPEKIQEFMRDKHMSRTEQMDKEDGRT